jgi:hypothetical protein
MLYDMSRYLENGMTIEQIEMLLTKEAVRIEQEKAILKHNDSALNWLKTEPKVIGETLADVYVRYHLYCLQNRIVPLIKSSFNQTIYKELNLISLPKSIKGKSVRIFIESDYSRPINSKPKVDGKIICTTTNRVFFNVNEASKHYKVQARSIINCLNGTAEWAGKTIKGSRKLYWERYYN